MRVVIDATPLLVRSAGVKNYLFHWIAALRKASPDGMFGTFPELGAHYRLNHDRSATGPLRTIAGLGMLALQNYTPLPVIDSTIHGADIFHTSSLVRRPPRGPRLTTTLHDLSSWIMPEVHPEANRRADSHVAGHLRLADRIIAVSEYTRQDAIKVLGIPPEKIVTIHSGVADPFFNVEPSDVARVREAYSLRRPFVLSIGTVEPRKNIPALIAAFEALPASVREEFELVLAGPMGWADQGTADKLRSVRYLGYVPEADIAPLTAAALVFAYPSLYEGFGFPVAQAMAAGVPVITSNVSALPEIAGDAAILVDPRSQSELSQALDRLLSSADLRSHLAALGRARAERFRWEACAVQSLRLFQQVAGE